MTTTQPNLLIACLCVILMLFGSPLKMWLYPPHFLLSISVCIGVWLVLTHRLWLDMVLRQKMESAVAEAMVNKNL